MQRVGHIRQGAAFAKHAAISCGDFCDHDAAEFLLSELKYNHEGAMADLTWMEQRPLEVLFDMRGGTVLDFSNQTFAEFIDACVKRQIYDDKYSFNGDSKAKRLRAFWKVESNHLVAKLLEGLLDYMHVEGIAKPNDQPRIGACRQVIGRLLAGHGVSELDTLTQIGAEYDLEIVAQAVRDAIDKHQPVLGLDRLHTFTTKFLRALCGKHCLTTSRDEPLHSIYGKYVKKLRDDGHLESKMTASILKSMHGPLDEFNKVRNDQSLAHDNTLLNHDEALLIFNHVTSGLRFLRDLDLRLERERQEAERAAKVSTALSWDDEEIPF